jgi:NAD(P)-dependent dehydrogenase (short-subunit alcohol dehydrogenase family)
MSPKGTNSPLLSKFKAHVPCMSICEPNFPNPTLLMHPRRCDVTKEADIATAVDTAVQQYGQLDIMFNNAGIIGERGPIDQARVEEFDHTLDVNLRSTFLGIKHAAQVMKERKTGTILSTASTAAKLGGLGPHG